jgi:hypothetical protein|tara:strand:- start:9124 stop:9231 length:108 start_codon:yes stop_codon:yes gene_type:complete
MANLIKLLPIEAPSNIINTKTVHLEILYGINGIFA